MRKQHKDFYFSSTVGAGERDMLVPTTHWRELSPDDSFLNQKVVLCLPGDGATSPEKSNGMVKVIQTLFPVSVQRHFRFVGVYYPDVRLTAAHRIHLLKETNQLKDRLDAVKEKSVFFDPYYADFFEKYLKPLVVTSGGKKRTVAQAKKNLQNLIMIGHCHGSAFAFQMEICFQETLARAGYTAQEQAEIQKKLVIVAFASQIPVGISKSTLFHITSVADPHRGMNGRAENLHTFFANQKEENHKTSLMTWNDHEAALLTKRICLLDAREQKDPKRAWDHTLLAFLGKEEVVQQRTPSGKQAVFFVKGFLRRLVTSDTREDSIKEMLSAVPYQRFVQNALGYGRQLGCDFREYQYACMRGRTGLFQAIKAQNIEKVKGFVDKGVPLELRNEKGMFPIHAAIRSHNQEIVDLVCTDTSYWCDLMSHEKVTPLIYALACDQTKMAVHLWHKISATETEADKSIGISREVKREALVFIIKRISIYPKLYDFFEQVTRSEFPIDKEDTLLLLKTAEELKSQNNPVSQKIAATFQAYLKSFLKNLPPKLFFEPLYRQETTLAEELSYRSDDDVVQRIIQEKERELKQTRTKAVRKKEIMPLQRQHSFKEL